MTVYENYDLIAFKSCIRYLQCAWNPIRSITLLAKALNEKNRKRWPFGATENDLLNKKCALIKKS